MSRSNRPPRRAECSAKVASAGIIASVVAGVMVAGSPRIARACGATCDVPEFWDVHFAADGALSVVSNFGLLRETPLGFELVCEQALSDGLITDAAIDTAGYVVAMTDGLYEQAGDVCEYRRVDLAAGDDWPFAFEVVPTASDSGESERWALVLDQAADVVNVVRAREGEPFSSQASFPSALGLRWLDVAGAHVFVSGHSHAPTTWNVAHSSDGAEWTQHHVELPEGISGLEPLGVDADLPELLLLRSTAGALGAVAGVDAGPSDGQFAGERGELWSFDAATGQSEPEWTLPEGLSAVGFAALGERWFVALSGDAGGQIASAQRGSFDFEAHSAALPALGCLRASETSLFICGADFTRDVTFIVAESTDAAQSWRPRMALADLAVAGACLPACRTTLDWLQATYGFLSVPGLLPPPDSGAPNPDADGGDSDAEGSSGRGQSGCRLGASGNDAARDVALLLGLVGAALLLRRG